jgi:putative mRNA 3-end processing factor
MAAAETWLYPTPSGLFCAPGGFYIDPPRPTDRAVITHGHSDHARSGHAHVLATAETIAIMNVRYGANCAGTFEVARTGETQSINGVTVRFVPAGHILGSAQIVLEWQGTRIVVSGDYKRAPDPTCAPFELVPCDVFITEATFALPVFRHGPAETEIARLLSSLSTYPSRTHLVGAYGLGKCQRILKLVRQAGYDKPIYLHGAHIPVTQLYEQLGQSFGDLRPANDATKENLAGALILCPPSALADRWSQKFDDPVTAFASGWMRVRGRVRQRGVTLPLIISDHADWPDLIDTIIATGATDVWVTHGRDDALVHHLATLGRRARALALIGRDDEAE